MKRFLAIFYIISLLCLMSCQNHIYSTDDTNVITEQLVLPEMSDDVFPSNFMYEQMILSELPDSAIPFCENNIPVSGGHQMIMCEDSNEPLGYSAFIKGPNGMYTKVNLLIPDTIAFDSVKLLAMPSGGGGSGEDTIYLELTLDSQTQYVFFTTSLFSSEYWWNYVYRGQAPYSAEEVFQMISENKSDDEETYQASDNKENNTDEATDLEVTEKSEEISQLENVEKENVNFSASTDITEKSKQNLPVDNDAIASTIPDEIKNEVSVAQPITDERITVIDGITYVDGILIVNKTYPLPESYAPQYEQEVLDSLNRMFSDASKAGYTFKTKSGYRSYIDQKIIYNNYVAKDGKALADTYSARPGHSEHQSALAFDLNQLLKSFGDTPEGIWLAQNCHKYGFIIRYPKGKEHITGYMYEPWHVRYLGVDIATKVYESGLCLEEYLGITSEYSY